MKIRSRNAQTGISLIELMIAMTLGLVILAGVISVFIASRQTFRTQEAVAGIQETGRFLNYMMFPYIRQAGFLPDPINQSDPTVVYPAGRLAIIGTDNAPPPSAYGITQALATADSITIRYLGRDLPGSPGTPDGVMPLCQNLNPVSPATNGLRADTMGENTFYIGPRNDGLSDLLCKARILNLNGTVNNTSSAPQPLLSGVQDMQILYGISQGASTAPVRYLNASQVTDWTRVAAVRFTFTVDSTERVEAGRANTAGGGDGVQNGRIRRTFSSTLQVRNRLTP